ncbi:hypothetical protein P152DRAFT_94496 [Eremomyces bilateralis CBS 781.70]|uniref:Uncharacterized protein n=1 Tax=Eremomyces bilateralis CBS 781.70 TaxID=1392243 RepID=A0A6G1FY75_9PEZI|nr:uncharacterized protein P152DRAFT_305142 [Eremomyces bilateralis CBS 781.70]XP_033532355.1 uncharacterized protein P152DRAFT_94496 [Eremomyces bilateralis CBS 781.70]KAF1807860.1 hypothetical protein P152DRAFT_305142 [Eremomyces bilateralis CBS 781.70]KAF1810724.1 hypothetical protein P152DRAFT_94496 [Eremomyces bilateralis CBS 781.70]
MRRGSYHDIEIILRVDFYISSSLRTNPTTLLSRSASYYLLPCQPRPSSQTRYLLYRQMRCIYHHRPLSRPHLQIRLPDQNVLPQDDPNPLLDIGRFGVLQEEKGFSHLTNYAKHYTYGESNSSHLKNFSAPGYYRITTMVPWGGLQGLDYSGNS